MKEPRARADTLPSQHPICTLSITLPDYTGPLPTVAAAGTQAEAPLAARYAEALRAQVDAYPHLPLELIAKRIGGDWLVLNVLSSIFSCLKIVFKKIIGLA